MRNDSRRHLCCRVRPVCSRKSHHSSCTQDCHWCNHNRSRAGYHWSLSLRRNTYRRHLCCCRVRPVYSKKSHHSSCTQDCHCRCQDRLRAGYHWNQSLMKSLCRRNLCCRARPVNSRKCHSERKQKKNLHRSSPMLTSLYSHHLSQPIR